MIEESTYPVLTPVEFIDRLKQEVDRIVTKIPRSDLMNERRLKHLIEGYEAHYANQWGGDHFYLARIAIFDGIMRILFRLTQKPAESLVPLRDLLDNIDTKDNWATARATNYTYLFFRDLLGELTKLIPFPIRYYPSSTVFERNRDTLNQVIVIENVKAVLSGTCPHCNANYAKEQVEAFSRNETITCKFCDHSVKAEWHS